MFDKILVGIENADEASKSKQEIIDYVAQMIIDGHLEADASLLGIDSKEDRDGEWEQDTFEKSLAVTYLEMVYNTSSMYSANETLLYLSGAYSRSQ